MYGRILIHKQNFQSQLQKLSNIAQKYKFQIEISQEGIVVNAKSLIGLLVLDYESSVNIVCKTADKDEEALFFKKIKKIFAPETGI